MDAELDITGFVEQVKIEMRLGGTTSPGFGVGRLGILFESRVPIDGDYFDRQNEALKPNNTIP
jgi:hypothetical protein